MGYVVARDEEHLQEWAKRVGVSARDYRRITQVGEVPIGETLICLLPLKPTTVELMDLRGLTLLWPPLDKKAMRKSAHRMYNEGNGKDPGSWVEYKGVVRWGNPVTKPYEVL